LDVQNNYNGNFKSKDDFHENNFAQNLEIVNPKTKETHNFNFDRIFSETDTQEEVSNFWIKLN